MTVVEVNNWLDLESDGNEHYCKESDVEFMMEDGTIVLADVDYNRKDGKSYQGQIDVTESLEVDVNRIFDEDGFEMLLDEDQKTGFDAAIREFLIDKFNMEV